MCIIKMVLETENPQVIEQFIREYHNPTLYPVELSKSNIDNYIKNHKKYSKLLKYPDSELNEDNEVVIRCLTEDEKRFLCSIIRQGFNEYVKTDYERENFHVEIVDSCSAAWENGKAFYVFPTSYSSSPILNF